MTHAGCRRSGAGDRSDGSDSVDHRAARADRQRQRVIGQRPHRRVLGTRPASTTVTVRAGSAETFGQYRSCAPGADDEDVGRHRASPPGGLPVTSASRRGRGSTAASGGRSRRPSRRRSARRPPRWPWSDPQHTGTTDRTDPVPAQSRHQHGQGSRFPVTHRSRRTRCGEGAATVRFRYVRRGRRRPAPSTAPARVAALGPQCRGGRPQGVGVPPWPLTNTSRAAHSRPNARTRRARRSGRRCRSTPFREVLMFPGGAVGDGRERADARTVRRRGGRRRSRSGCRCPGQMRTVLLGRSDRNDERHRGTGQLTGGAPQLGVEGHDQ